MTDDWTDDGSDFDDAFFASLEASPDEASVEADDLAAGQGLDLDFERDEVEGDFGVDEFLYEAEGDGSFETDAADLDSVDIDAVHIGDVAADEDPLGDDALDVNDEHPFFDLGDH